MGEKRKSRTSTNERTAKKEKKIANDVSSNSIHDDIEEQTSINSNVNGTENHEQEQAPSITKENTDPEEIEESEEIPPIDGETTVHEENGESKSSPDDDNDKVTNQTNATSKSWWSSLIRLFHFRNNTNENKPQMNGSADHQSSSQLNGSYLSNIKCRRSLHEDSIVH